MGFDFRAAVKGPPLDFEHEEQYNGGSKRPNTHTLHGVHPETGDRVGWLTYDVPRRKADKIYVQRMEVDPEHKGNGYAGQLMDEMQRRHPGTPIDHGDRTPDGQAWWDSYTQDKPVRRGRTIAVLEEDDDAGSIDRRGSDLGQATGPQAPESVAGDETPAACSYCGSTDFKDLTDNGRVRQATCAACGGTMSAHDGAQWTPELIGDPSNHPKPDADPHSGGVGGAAAVGMDPLVRDTSRLAKLSDPEMHEVLTRFGHDHRIGQQHTHREHTLTPVKHAGFKGYVEGYEGQHEDQMDEDREAYGSRHPNGGFDEDLWEHSAPEMSTHEREHHEEWGELPDQDDYYDRHAAAYEKAKQEKDDAVKPVAHHGGVFHMLANEMENGYKNWHAKGEIRKVDLSNHDVYATQPHVVDKHVNRYLRNPGDTVLHVKQHGMNEAQSEYPGTHRPMFIKHENDLFTVEGHHRTASALLRKEPVEGIVYDADKHGFPHYEPDEYGDEHGGEYEKHEGLQKHSARSRIPTDCEFTFDNPHDELQHAIRHHDDGVCTATELIRHRGTPKTAAVDGPDWCTWRRAAQCTFPNDRNNTLLTIPQVRGACPWTTRYEQQICPISEPGPQALMSVKGSSTVDDSWKNPHRAPEAGDGSSAPMHDVESMMPDFHEHPEYYDAGQEDFHTSANAIRSAHGNPEKKIRVYRALPAEHAHKGIQTGDWVTTSKEYALLHGRHHEDSKHDWPVIRATVPAKHLHTEGDVHEWGYSGPPKSGMVAFKGGYHQEVRQGDEGVVPVKRRPKKEASMEALSVPQSYELAKVARQDPEMAFHVTAAWSDVRSKAKRIRSEGKVMIKAATNEGLAGMVEGDHGTYENMITYRPGSRKIADWSCNCKWGEWAWDRIRFHGRQCSHSLALQYEAQSRGMFGREVHLGALTFGASVELDEIKGISDKPISVIARVMVEAEEEPGDIMKLLMAYGLPHSGALQVLDSALNRTAAWHDDEEDDSEPRDLDRDENGNCKHFPDHEHEHALNENGYNGPVKYCPHLNAHTDWDRVYPSLGDEVHRGLSLNLHQQPGLHELVHDESKPVGERAQALSDFAKGDHLGAHWTDSKTTAYHYTNHMDHGVGEKPTKVVFHGLLPEREHIETNPHELHRGDVIGYEKHGDSEIPLQHGSPVTVHGVSWHSNGDWKHHDFGSQTQQHTASVETEEERKRKKRNHTNDTRRHAPDFGRGVPGWIPLPLGWCPQCDGNGCGHCGGTAQVALDGYGHTANPVPDQNGDEGPMMSGGISDTSSLRHASWDDDEHEHNEDCAEYGCDHENGDGDHWENTLKGTHEIHRGVGVLLHPSIHRIVHDESRPVHERAHLLLREIGKGDPERRRGMSALNLGTHWTTDKGVAEDFAERHNSGEVASGKSQNKMIHQKNHMWGTEDDGTPEGQPATAVVIHAKPDLNSIDHHPDSMAHGSSEIYDYHDHGEREVPYHPGASVEVKGISWKPVHEYNDHDYTRHDFHEPQFHHALKQNGPTCSGVALKAADTGRVLMLQRGLGENHPAAGQWEFPGGHHEEGDTTSLHAGIREWQEEVGQQFPEGGTVHHTWTSPDGVYQGHVVVIPSEKDLSMKDGRVVPNPDDPKGDEHEQAAWWDINHAKGNKVLRDEVRAHTPWSEIAKAGEQKTASAWDPLTGEGDTPGFPYAAPLHSNSKNPASTGFATSEDPKSWTSENEIPDHLLPSSSYDSSYYGMLHDSDDVPEPALPSTDGADPDGYRPPETHGSIADVEESLSPNQFTGAVNDIVTAFQATAGAKDIMASMPGPTPGGDDVSFDFAAAARQYLAQDKGMQKSALKDFSFPEQQELINEGKAADVRARNFSNLQIEGTHYEALGNALGLEDEDAEGIFT